MRWLLLYLRSRGVLPALAVALGTIALVWTLAVAYADQPTINVRLISLTVMLAVVAFASGLGAADNALEHTAAVNWPLRRLAHLVLTGAVIIGVLLLSTVTERRFEPVALVARDTVGLLGLTALGAAVVGASRSWIAPLTWTLVTAIPWVDASTKLKTQILAWPIQPAGTTAATISAGVLAVSGLLAYTAYGCPRRP